MLRVFSEGFCKGFAAFYLFEYVVDHIAQCRFGSQFRRNGQTPVQWKARTNESGQFFGEEQNIPLRNTLQVKFWKQGSLLSRRFFDGNGNQAHIPKSMDNRRCIPSVNLSFGESSLGIHGFVTKDSHQTS